MDERMIWNTAIINRWSLLAPIGPFSGVIASLTNWTDPPSAIST